MASTTKYARSPRPQGGGFELASWFYMRVSGAILSLMIIFHLMWMHYVIGLSNITFDVIAGRWTDPNTGTLWRTFDLVLLILALVHGMNGTRFALEDYIHNRGWRVFAKTLLFVVFFFVIIAGAYVIFTFNG